MYNKKLRKEYLTKSEVKERLKNNIRYTRLNILKNRLKNKIEYEKYIKETYFDNFRFIKVKDLVWEDEKNLIN